MKIPGPAQGFTLIELSIVLVIIGLIVGAVLVGQDLIRAAGVRATLTQVEKFNSAANTFFGKYGALPGDLNASVASRFGFAERGSYAGQGDGNGIIEGSAGCAGCDYGFVESEGETVMFWVDLSTANGLNVNLIDGGFSTASPSSAPGSTVSGAALAAYLPQAKLGNGNYFYVYSQGGAGSSMGTNYYGLSAVSAINSGAVNGCGVGCISSTPGLTVKQAYDIDKKIDDGLPTTGRVLTQYADAATFGAGGVYLMSGPASPSATSCYDSTSLAYSLSQNGGNGINCALSFKFQAGD